MLDMLLTAEEMGCADRRAIDFYGIDEEILIENAALALFSECPEVKSARIFAGSGNNGADGYALARHLFLNGTDTEIIALFPTKCKNAEICKKLGIKITPFPEMEDKDTDLIVDALFGTGLSRNIEGDAEKLISYMNGKEAFKLAVDIPSGVNADTGGIMGCAFKADKTVTFGFFKTGLFQYPGHEMAGKIVKKYISIPADIPDSSAYLVDGISFDKRSRNTNKGHYGNILCVAGSKGMAGAAYMAAKAALKTGCGLLTVAVPDVIINVVAKKIPEAMTIGCSHNGKTFSREALSDIKEAASKANTLLIGPGIRKSEETAYLVKEAIKLFSGKNIIIDADGLNCLADEPEFFKGAVITPHPGEMARLMGCDIASVEKDRRLSASSFAKKYGCTVVLKGAITITATPDGKCFYNTTGNPGMAKGGSGDVLSGITASFLAQGMEGAAYKAAYLHGLSGDLCLEKFSEYAFTATDLIKMIPDAIKKCMA
ncbi:MAG: NAD(P)H-hydrate dehydratase, partial [Clostridia bacterium]|nr:NAD(P)H-hydrate dehydratase [Clostridia bacterium]